MRDDDVVEKARDRGLRLGLDIAGEPSSFTRTSFYTTHRVRGHVDGRVDARACASLWSRLPRVSFSRKRPKLKSQEAKSIDKFNSQTTSCTQIFIVDLVIRFSLFGRESSWVNNNNTLVDSRVFPRVLPLFRASPTFATRTRIVRSDTRFGRQER